MQVQDKNRLLEGTGINTITQGIRTISKPYLHLQRYKDLGEMDAEQLWETAMDPQTRSLCKYQLKMHLKQIHGLQH